MPGPIEPASIIPAAADPMAAAQDSANAPTHFPTDGDETRSGGSGSVIRITNADFLAEVFTALPEDAFAAVCIKFDDPSRGGWRARRADQTVAGMFDVDNNFVSCSSYYYCDDGAFRAMKTQFAACHFLMLDDIGTKIEAERLAGFEPSWVIETSPGNHQIGIIFAEPITDGAEAVRLHKALIAAGLCDPGARGPMTRWARLPVGINGKPKHADANGAPFPCRLVEFRPSKRYTPQEIVDQFHLELAPARKPKNVASSAGAGSQNRGNEANTNKVASPAGAGSQSTSNGGNAVLTPAAAENPVITALKVRGLYKTLLGPGKHDITCPWIQEHTDVLDNGTAYFEPTDDFPSGGFCCQHSHGDNFHIRALLKFLGVGDVAARNKPVIRKVDGDLNLVVDMAEKVLAENGCHYQVGGLIASVSTDAVTSDPSIVPTSLSALTRDLSRVATWTKYDKRAEEVVQIDPPARPVTILHEEQTYRYLPPLAGLARQPYFRELDWELVIQPGYDPASRLFGVFNAGEFVLPEPTEAAAREALAMLEDLLTEFHFVDLTDKAAALSAIFTAVVRPSLPHAPAFHVRAPVSGSGKSYLCDLFGAFAGPGFNSKMSFPASAEEATKVILASLLPGPAVIEFDDMDTDLKPYGVINRMLTAEHITDRILGVSRTATVSTRTLFLSSGNNVGPVRDLLRRVLTIHIDPRCATPATITYKDNPVEKVRRNRGTYVAAVLTIIRAFRRAGEPRAKADSIATFDGAWSTYCRYPLMWLGYPDPATALLEQVRHDPDAEMLGALMATWWKLFGSKPMTLRNALREFTEEGQQLREAICEFPVEERSGEINRSKLGWLLKKNAGRIVGDYMFQQAEADGRLAWRVVPVKTPPLPPLPPFASPAGKCVIQQEIDELM